MIVKFWACSGLDVNEVRTFTARDGDLILLTLHEGITPDQVRRASEMLSTMLNNAGIQCGILVGTGVMDLQAFSDQDLADLGLQRL